MHLYLIEHSGVSIICFELDVNSQRAAKLQILTENRYALDNSFSKAYIKLRRRRLLTDLFIVFKYLAFQYLTKLSWLLGLPQVIKQVLSFSHCLLPNSTGFIPDELFKLLELHIYAYVFTPRVRGWYQHLNSDVILGVRHFKAVSQTRFSN